MRTIEMGRLSVLFLTGSLLFGCIACGDDGPYDPKDLRNTQWALVSMGKTGAETPALPTGTLTLRLTEAGDHRAFGGTAGCNGYGGIYEAKASGSIAFGSLWSTAMVCSTPEGIREQVGTYMTILQKVTRYTLGPGRLDLATDANDHLVFSPAP